MSVFDKEKVGLLKQRMDIPDWAMDGLKDPSGRIPDTFFEFMSYRPEDLETQYKDYDTMDEESEDISAFLDAVAEEATLKNRDRGATVWVEGPQKVVDILTELIERLELETRSVEICRNIAKYGRWVYRPIFKEEFGPSIYAISDNVYDDILTRNKMKAVYDKPYYITVVPVITKSQEWLGYTMNAKLYKQWEFVEFKVGHNLLGTSMIAQLANHVKRLALSEKAVELYRVTKAPQIMIYKVPVDDSDPMKIVSIMKMFQKLIGSKNSVNGGGVNRQKVMASPISDIWWPQTTNEKGGVEVVNTSADITQLADLDYKRKKIKGKLRMPDDMSDQSKYVSSVAVSVLRKVQTLQEAYCRGLDRLFQIELSLHGIPIESDTYTICMSRPTDIEETLRLEKIQLAVDLSTQLTEIGKTVAPADEQEVWARFASTEMLKPYLGDFLDRYDAFKNKNKDLIGTPPPVGADPAEKPTNPSELKESVYKHKPKVSPQWRKAQRLKG